LVILGTGNMAASHAAHFAAIEGVEIVGAIDIDSERASKFAQDYQIPRTFSSLEDALDWGTFDAVANVTPDRFHHQTSMKAIAAGTHGIGERPLGTIHDDAIEVAEAAERAGVIDMVNLTYRNVAELQKFRQLVDEGASGAIKHVEASYLQ